MMTTSSDVRIQRPILPFLKKVTTNIVSWPPIALDIDDPEGNKKTCAASKSHNIAGKKQKLKGSLRTEYLYLHSKILHTVVDLREKLTSTINQIYTLNVALYISNVHWLSGAKFVLMYLLKHALDQKHCLTVDSHFVAIWEKNKMRRRFRWQLE